MDYTKSVGNITELKCLIAFMSMGFDCSIPYGDNAKYDIILDVGDELLRIQCKSSKFAKSGSKIDTNAFSFSCSSQTTNTKKTVRHSYKGLIDYFATVWKDKVYLIPVDECSLNKTLRLSPPSNNISYNAAEDYEVEKVLGHKMSSKFKLDSELKINSVNNSTLNNHISKYKCPICGTNVSQNGVLCPKCAALASRKVERPSREELKALIRTTPFVQIGKTFGVSDNTIKKWCKGYELPSKSREIKQISEEDWKVL